MLYNTFTLSETDQMAWEVIEKQGDYEVTYRWSPPNKRQRIFALDDSDQGSKFFSFSRRKMSEFEFNPVDRNFPIFGAEYRNIPTKPPINYRLWIVELI